MEQFIDLFFYATLLGLFCAFGGLYLYFTEVRPVHRANRAFGERLREQKARLQTEKLRKSKEFLAQSADRGLMK